MRVLELVLLLASTSLASFLPPGSMGGGDRGNLALGTASR